MSPAAELFRRAVRACGPALAALLLSLCAAGAGEPAALRPPPPPRLQEPAPQPWDLWALDYQSGVLWRVSNATFRDYLVLPQIISLRTPAHAVFDLGDGHLALRTRLSLLAEPVVRGPESLYLGFSGSPSIEWWLPGERTHLYLSVGGGFGWIDSTGEAGGQGQDFTWNWFASGGLRTALTPRLSLSLGLFYQHWSNRGATDPNPGLDALGPLLGVSWTF